jgi:hypothetical protein
MNILKPPYIKGKGFCPNPIVRYGIPKEADETLNPNVIGTAVYEEFWNEEIRRCIHGYTTGGIFIPGRYYYFLNYKKFKVVGRGIVDADICDLHLELAYWIEDCKKRRRNGILAKKRRGGISEAFITMVVDYGFRFLPGYTAGVAAGMGTFKDEFMKKWEEHNNLIVPVFSKKITIGDDDEIIASYKKQTPKGWTVSGSQNTIYNKTMFQNANLFKGLMLNDVCAEEGVEFKNLKTFFQATEACLRYGSVQEGNFWTWGTGGNRSSNGDDFEEMWHNPDVFKMEKFFIKGTRFHHPFFGGAKDKFGALIQKVPNLSEYKDYQLIGVEDQDAAEADIKMARDIAMKSGDVASYIEECQNNPLTVEEVFKKSSSNKFDIDILNNIGFELASSPKGYVKYKLEWVKNENGDKVLPLKVTPIAAKDTDLEDDCILISHDGLPMLGIPNLYAAGLDSYDQDQSKTSKSLGAMLVMTRGHKLANQPVKKPVCVVRTRPKRKEDFYEMCLKVAVFYNITNGVLVDVAKPMVIEYFKSNGGTRFLARRPKKFESVNSEQQHEYGVSLNKYSRPAMVSVMQSYVLDHGRTIVFPKLIDELKAYDEYTNDSDNDLADALGIALMQDISNSIDPRDQSTKDRNQKYLINDGFDFNPPKLKSLEQDHDGFGSR